MYWAVGLIQGRLVIQGQLDNREDVRMKMPRTNYDCEGLGR